MGLPEPSPDFPTPYTYFKNVRIFSTEAVEYFDEDLQYLKNGDRLYISTGKFQLK